MSSRAAACRVPKTVSTPRTRVATTAAVIIFRPAAFLVGGDKQTAAEFGQIKGQSVAIGQASNAKKCNIQFQGKPPRDVSRAVAQIRPAQATTPCCSASFRAPTA